MKLTDKLLGIIAQALLIIALNTTKTSSGREVIMQLNDELKALT